MPLTSRRSRPIPRTEGRLRDARLFVVATEDTCAPKQYFSFFPHPRVHVEVLETHDGRSSPTHVVERLVSFAKTYQIAGDDQLWALIDTDHWIRENHRDGLIEAIKSAREKGFFVVLSNPCFDLWLLLHHLDLPPGHQFADCDAVGSMIRGTMGEFNKLNLKPEAYPVEAVATARARARALEAPGGDPTKDFWPQSTGTRVYLLIEALKSAGLGF